MASTGRSISKVSHITSASRPLAVGTICNENGSPIHFKVAIMKVSFVSVVRLTVHLWLRLGLAVAWFG